MRVSQETNPLLHCKIGGKCTIGHTWSREVLDEVLEKDESSAELEAFCRRLQSGDLTLAKGAL